MEQQEAYSELDRAVLEEINQAMPSLTSGSTYTMKALLSEEFLNCFDGLHPLLGRRLAFLVENKLLPMERVGRTNANHAIYKVL
ncbi:MAG: hypothetical protein Q7U82_00775 [Gammaproteobacteria bacterium]|nr:hypothetical protein [Gammaproteobacteria bacterium]